MLSYAVLIDGGFAIRKLGSKTTPMTAETLSAYLQELSNSDALREHRLHRVYYYDAAPLDSKHSKPLSGGHIDFGKQPSAGRMKSLHQQLVKHAPCRIENGRVVLSRLEGFGQVN